MKVKNRYQVFGAEPVEIVVEMGLGACLGEWIPCARMMEEQGKSVLLYERAGINKSPVSGQARTPRHIAEELAALLETVEHTEQIILIAHSQGGLYAQQFCRMYPQMVKKLILLDPLTARDNEFKKQLSEKEYKQSGVDKSFNFKIMKVLAGLKLGGIAKNMLRNAPPFYYYDGFNKEEQNDILNAVKKTTYAKTALAEYELAHEEENLSGLSDTKGFPDIPLILVTHSSELAIEESMKFGNNTRAFATKVEEMWQELMEEYLTYSKQSVWIRAEKSTHFIHLMEPEIILENI